MNLSVFYSHDLSDFAKILYFEIENLAKKKGFCYAYADYFSKKFNKTERHIKRILKELSDFNFINLEKNQIKIQVKKGQKCHKNMTKMSENDDKNVQNDDKNVINATYYMNSEIRTPRYEYSDCENFSHSQHEKNQNRKSENEIQKTKEPNFKNSQTENSSFSQKENLQNSQAKNQKSKNSNFTKPTLSELKKFVYEAGLEIDCEHFYDYYEANGWLVGNKAKMRDWKACVRNWARNNAKFNSSQKKTQKEQNAEVMSEWDRQMDEREFYESCDNAKATHNNAQNDLYKYCDDFVEAEILTKGA
ncbi:MAG: hypothetical protein IKR42_04660 [Campylobacter sp.]|nr:hypothetical protein [Campylobacter sp.]